MRFFVIHADGQRYGPADMVTLNKWVAEGRITPLTEVENVDTGQRMAASALTGLSFGSSTMYAPTAPTYGNAPGDWTQPPGSPYPRAGNYPVANAQGQSEMTLAWVFAALAIAGACFYGCFGVVLGVLGIYFANKAVEKGQPAAAARTLAIVATVISGLIFVAYLVFFAFAFSSGMR